MQRQIRHSIEIDRPADEVWDWIEDPLKLKVWMTGLVFSELTSEPPAREGSTLRMGVQEGRKVAEYQGTITACDRPRQLAVRLVGGCMREGAMEVAYRLTDLGGRTRVDYECAADLRGIWRVFGFLFRIFGTFQVRSFFQQLKEHAEAAPPAAVRT